MVAIVDAQSTTVTALGGGIYRVEKTGGAAGAFDASAVSAAAIAGDCVLRVRDLSAPNNLVFGLSVNPGENPGYDKIDHAVQFYLTDLYVYERGALIPPARQNAGTVWIVRSGNVLSYLVGDYPATAMLARKIIGVTAPLWFDSSIVRANGAIEVRFDPPGSWCEPPGGRRRTLGLALGAKF